jgi:hypothetical protein
MGNKILDGMTRDEALGCVCHRANSGSGEYFVKDGLVYLWVSDLGIKDDASVSVQFTSAITAYYAERDKPRWVKPEPSGWAEPPISDAIGFHTKGFCPNCREQFYSKGVEDHHAEIARTNARREVEAFIRANGGAGTPEKNWIIVFDPYRNQWITEDCGDGWMYFGMITCATKELADEVIRRFPAQLRLLAGEAGK